MDNTALINNVENNSSSGFHMFEFHLPSSMSTALILGVTAGLIILLYKCAKSKGMRKATQNVEAGKMISPPISSRLNEWNPIYYSTPKRQPTRKGEFKRETPKDSKNISDRHIYDTVYETKQESKKRPFIVYS